MRLLLQVFLKSVVVVLSAVVGLAAAVLAVRAIPPLEIAPGVTEGTPVQLAAFLAAFAITFLIALAVGMHWVERYVNHGLPKT